jgi:hypothetical protein
MCGGFSRGRRCWTGRSDGVECVGTVEKGDTIPIDWAKSKFSAIWTRAL